MAHYHDYRGAPNDRINYADLETSRSGSKAIFLVLALIAAATVAMFMFGDVSTTNLENPAPAGALETTPAPTVTPVE